MASTYTPLSTQTLGSSASSITFSSISSAYTDIVLVLASSTVSGAVTNHYLRVNGDTGSNYSYTRLYGDGTSAGSDRGTNSSLILLGEVGTTITNNIIHFQNYSNTTTYKTILNRGNATIGTVNGVVGLWRSTSAINSITVFPISGSFATGTTATIYGIAAA